MEGDVPLDQHLKVIVYSNDVKIKEIRVNSPSFGMKTGEQGYDSSELPDADFANILNSIARNLSSHSGGDIVTVIDNKEDKKSNRIKPSNIFTAITIVCLTVICIILSVN